MYLGLGIWEIQGYKNWNINQGISDEEKSEAISSTPNFKACVFLMGFQ